VFDVHGQSLSDRALAVGPGGVPVRSRHGLTFVPRADLATVGPRIDRLLVPGAARDVPTPVGGPAPEYVHDRPGFAYDAVLGDLSRTTDRATAVWVAKALELPADARALDGPAWPWAPTAFALGLLAASAVAGGLWLRRARAGTSPRVLSVR
jgi:hypothetical protein